MPASSEPFLLRRIAWEVSPRSFDRHRTAVGSLHSKQAHHKPPLPSLLVPPWGLALDPRSRPFPSPALLFITMAPSLGVHQPELAPLSHSPFWLLSACSTRLGPVAGHSAALDFPADPHCVNNPLALATPCRRASPLLAPQSQDFCQGRGESHIWDPPLIYIHTTFWIDDLGHLRVQARHIDWEPCLGTVPLDSVRRLQRPP